MFQRPEDATAATSSAQRTKVVVAGPGSSLTIPGLIASEITQALMQSNAVTRIEVDLGTNFTSGLHRAPSLAAAHEQKRIAKVVRHRAPNNARLRAQAFKDWIGPDVLTAIAYAWPGLDNEWIAQFLEVAKAAGARTTVMCVSLPLSSRPRALSLSELLHQADLVLVGDDADAAELTVAFNATGPKVETHRALSLGGRVSRSGTHHISAFLPKDNCYMLSTLLAAFDAIPEAWIDNYELDVVMRYTDPTVPKMIANSYHADHVNLTSEDISGFDLEQLCRSSSALIVADPAFDSRAFATAVDCGVATVVLATSLLPSVGSGYVGGLLADLDRPASVHVALAHALRLAELRFPSPDAWQELAERINGKTDDVVTTEVFGSVYQNR